MDLSIIIVNYKTRGLLKNCIKGIMKYPLNISYEIIVIDNDSRDGSVQMMQSNFPESKFPDIKLIGSSLNLGHAAGNNLGIKNAQGRYVLLMNSDIVITDNSLEQLVHAMDAHPQVAAGSCRLFNPDGSLQHNCRRFPDTPIPFYRRTILGRMKKAQKAVDEYLMTDFSHDKEQAIDWLLAACLIVRRKAIDQVGMLDERFFVYFADVDWCKQFWKAGWQVYFFPEPSVIHYYHRESNETGGLKSIMDKITRIHIRDWFQYLRKYGSSNI